MSKSKTIDINFIWDKNILLNSFDAIYNHEYKNSPRRLLGWIFIGMAQFGVVAALKKDSFGLLIFSTIMLVYWFYGKKYLAKRRILKAFEQDKLKDKNISVKVDEDGLEIDSLLWQWEEIDGIEDVENGFLIIKYPKHYFIPTSGFKDFEDKSRFKSSVKEYFKK